MRCLLLVMCTDPFAKKALTRHLARSEGHERYFGCNLMHRKVLASSHQHLMTEAPLTAFVIILRRLRRAEQDDGSGVAVLMRYTLRLLTIQQFQRAAAMICACELLRRQGEAGLRGVPNLGKSPIGIGLWVGAKATPLTLHDAFNHQAGDPSTPEQLTACPCCGGSLKWKFTPRESSVECTEEEACELQPGHLLLEFREICCTFQNDLVLGGIARKCAGVSRVRFMAAGLWASYDEENQNEVYSEAHRFS